MRKSKACSEIECDYTKYYLNQLGGNINDILLYTGRPVQRGSGLFSKLRFGIPFLKTIGKEALKVGKNILYDWLSGKDFRKSAVSNIKSTTSNYLRKAADKVD